MKYFLIVPDGAADEPLAELDGKTPLEVARTPNLDKLAESSLVGSVQVTPLDMYPGSDAANMALLGYDPTRYYTGRGPIEAAAMGIPLDAKDVAFRCSLVSTDGETLLDYSAGHITTEEARPIIELANQKLGTRSLRLFPGVSYRHILRWTDGPTEVQTHPPHESMGKKLSEIYPQGDMDSKIRRFSEDSLNLLDDLPFNRQRKGRRQTARQHAVAVESGTNAGTAVVFQEAGHDRGRDFRRRCGARIGQINGAGNRQCAGRDRVFRYELRGQSAGSGGRDGTARFCVDTH